MKKATGIHLTGRSIWVVSIEGAPSDCRLRALVQARLPEPFAPETLLDAQARGRLAQGIGDAIGRYRKTLGRTTASLGGGFFQIQKVPLEVASEEDRRNQLVWEASQALISPAGDYIVDFHPAGRVAFWVAVRRNVAGLCTRLYESADIPLDGFEVEPIALFHACAMAHQPLSGRNGAMLLGSPWLSFVAMDGDILIAAETVRADVYALSGAQDRGDADPPGRQDLSDVVRRWVYGDLSSDRRRAMYQQVFLCGNPEEVGRLIRCLRAPSSPSPAPLRPFSACNIDGLPEDQRCHLSSQSAFSVAAGLAYYGLKCEDTLKGKTGNANRRKDHG